MGISRKFIPSSLLRVSAGIYQAALLDESGMIRTQVEKHNISDSGRGAWDALYDTIP
jgi:hypothetical protein